MKEIISLKNKLEALEAGQKMTDLENRVLDLER